MDSEGLLQCPYDKNHMIRPSRFPYHLVKCRENNKDVAKVLATCPFNARHRVPKKELDLHMQSCESKCPLEPLPDNAFIREPERISSWQSPPSEENWEDEDSSFTSSPFVLNEFGNYQPYSTHETVYKEYPPRATSGASCSDQTNHWKPGVSNGRTLGSYTGDTVMQKPERSSSWQSPTCKDSWPVERSSPASAPPVLNKLGNHQPYSARETVYKQPPPSAASGESRYNQKNPWKPVVPNGQPSYAYISGSRPPNHQEPSYSNDGDWPRLGRH
ncbi:gametocyte-specific factor 1-like isoform X2 [Dendropsophus ebraccatus]